jgi:hypothetical protein
LCLKLMICLPLSFSLFFLHLFPVIFTQQNVFYIHPPTRFTETPPTPSSWLYLLAYTNIYLTHLLYVPYSQMQGRQVYFSGSHRETSDEDFFGVSLHRFASKLIESRVKTTIASSTQTIFVWTVSDVIWEMRFIAGWNLAII